MVLRSSQSFQPAKCGSKMNTPAREELRRVLRAQNAVLADPLQIEKRRLCRQGTEPTCEHNLGSWELFHFLEPVGNKQPLHVYDGDLQSYDLSSVIGHGVCSYAMYSAPARLEERMLIDAPVAGRFGTSVFDCANIETAVNLNELRVKRVMRHSRQPSTELRSIYGLIADFGLWRVANHLVAPVKHVSQRSVVESDDPRVLWCSDSLGNEMCRSLAVVPSSEGFSLAFNSEASGETFRDPTHRSLFESTFAKLPIPRSG